MITPLTDQQGAAVLALQEFNIGLAQEAMATRGCVPVAERYDALLLRRSVTAIHLVQQCRKVAAMTPFVAEFAAKLGRMILRPNNHV